MAVWVSAAAAFILALTVAIGAAQSPNNCGELPGITRTFVLLAAFAAAGLLAVLGLVVGIVRGRPAVAGGALLVAAAVAGGAATGAAVGHDPCAAAAMSVPGPTQQVADLRVILRAPATGMSLTGRAECQRQVRGGTVYKIVSVTNYAAWASAWRFGSTFVDLEVWPVTVGEYRPAEHLRVILNRPADGADPGASAYYSDGRGVAVSLTTTADGARGSISFEDLPLWKSDSRFGSGLPGTVSGQLSWECLGPET